MSAVGGDFDAQAVIAVIVANVRHIEFKLRACSGVVEVNGRGVEFVNLSVAWLIPEEVHVRRTGGVAIDSRDTKDRRPHATIFVHVIDRPISRREGIGFKVFRKGQASSKGHRKIGPNRVACRLGIGYAVGERREDGQGVRPRRRCDGGKSYLLLGSCGQRACPGKRVDGVVIELVVDRNGGQVVGAFVDESNLRGNRCTVTKRSDRAFDRSHGGIVGRWWDKGKRVDERTAQGTIEQHRTHPQFLILGENVHTSIIGVVHVVLDHAVGYTIAG